MRTNNSNGDLRSWTWRHGILKSDLPATTRHVLLTISCHMNDLGEGAYTLFCLRICGRKTGAHFSCKCWRHTRGGNGAVGTLGLHPHCARREGGLADGEPAWLRRAAVAAS